MNSLNANGTSSSHNMKCLSQAEKASSSNTPACMGEERAKQASCLPDLLLASPSEWLDRPLLRFREKNGQWVQWSRIRVQQAVLRVAAWLEKQGIQAGDRVGILGHNSPEWLIADFAILRIGAITVPAYFTDSPEAVQYVFDDAGCALVWVEAGAQQAKLEAYDKHVVLLRGDGESLATIAADETWDDQLQAPCPKPDDLATLIYTSGTTGHPKGVMLSHHNILTDVWGSVCVVPVFPNDVFLSFLPVSHAFERMAGHFLPMACGSEISYAEDITTLMRDMPEVRPSVIVSVPRLYEKIYAGVHAKMEASAIKNFLFKQAQSLGRERFELRQKGSDLQGLKGKVWAILDGIVNAKLRAKMGGNLRLFVSGGAALSPRIANFLLAADMIVLPGYGLSETSPVLTVNPMHKIKPASVGSALPGVQLKLADDGELLVKGDVVMRGYWHKAEESKQTFDSEGWLYTGDIAEIDDDGYVYIVDRKKEIMVLSSGENVPPALVEQHLIHDPCIEQAMVIGEGRAWLAALLAVNEEQLLLRWQKDKRKKLPEHWREDAALQAWMLRRIKHELSDLASYMQIRKIAFVCEEWTQDNGCLTPTMKLKRRHIRALHQHEIELFYAE
ncbi:MAG: AMP-dependent synthetase/ligase [Mariprofundaceae bacterium]|nr:AMP-dependent synthetase/ligase [Mariprofundaceae bacterium]